MASVLLASGPRVEPGVASCREQRVRAGRVHALGGPHDPATGQVSLIAVNRSEADPVTLKVDLLPTPDAADALVLSDPDLSAINSQNHPDRVQPRSLAVHTDGSISRFDIHFAPRPGSILERLRQALATTHQRQHHLVGPGAEGARQARRPL